MVLLTNSQDMLHDIITGTLHMSHGMTLYMYIYFIYTSYNIVTSSQDMLRDIITSTLHLYMSHDMTLYMSHDITTSN